MDTRAVGFFDSGLGGLTALNAFHAIAPEENIIYLADTLHCPYGSKDPEMLKHLAKANLQFMKQQNVKLIVVACGTMSANCKEVLAASEIHTENVLDVSLEALKKEAGSLGVIATEASIRSGAFSLRDRELQQMACPDFVPLIEKGVTSLKDRELLEAVRRYLTPLQGVSALLLGCTHYGIIRDAIGSFLGDKTKLLSASDCVAESAVRYLERKNLRGGTGTMRFYCTGEPETFDQHAERVLHGTRCGNLHAQRAWL